MAKLPFDPIAEARRNWEEHGWHQAAPGMAAVTSVVRAQQIMMARVEETLRPHDLTFARYELLQLLAFTRTGALPLSRIGDRLQVHPASRDQRRGPGANSATWCGASATPPTAAPRWPRSPTREGTGDEGHRQPEP